MLFNIICFLIIIQHIHIRLNSKEHKLSGWKFSTFICHLRFWQHIHRILSDICLSCWVCCAHLPQVLVQWKKKMKGKTLRSYGNVGDHPAWRWMTILITFILRWSPIFPLPQKSFRLPKEQGISGLRQLEIGLTRWITVLSGWLNPN